ncbi:MAG: Spo0E family sporulation regulatory protein-aspartic acid phosphatase [Clostridiaceae bacterium]|nr:Spo0E family sporulation regulatory protein-aspartic acid phosphatase [Clostridiaceae bacterium]
MRKFVLYMLIKGMQLRMNYLIQVKQYNLQSKEILRYSNLLDKRINAYQKLYRLQFNRTHI